MACGGGNGLLGGGVIYWDDNDDSGEACDDGKPLDVTDKRGISLQFDRLRRLRLLTTQTVINQAVMIMRMLPITATVTKTYNLFNVK